MKRRRHSLIEPLEDRIAPATIINPYTVTFQDTDGDTAVVHISKPLFKSAKAAGNILIFTTNDGSTEHFTGNNVGESLSEINLLGRHDAQDMNISVKVLPQVGVGNAQVDVGDIAAANFSANDQVSENIDLGKIYIQGNLGQITAGDNFSTPAIQSLNVLSMSEAAQSDVLGPITSMHVVGDFNANLDVIGYQFGSIGHLYIGGSLAGDSSGDTGTGVIQFSGHIGAATIGNITGTGVSSTGELVGTATNPSYIGSLRVLGSITGGAGQDSGRVFATNSIGKVIVGGSITGGAGQDSGEIAGPLKTVNIGGSLTGGAGISSGAILSETFNTLGQAIALPLTSVTIGGDVTGGTAGVAANGTTAATPGDSGIILATSARSIIIAGSLTGGAAGAGTNTNGVLDQTADTSGDILVNTIKSLTIGKNIVGGSGPNSGIVTGDAIAASGGSNGFATISYNSIVVYGSMTGGSGNTSGSILANSFVSGAIGSLRLGGDLTGGSGTQSGEIYGNAGITTLRIGGDVTGGSANGTGEIFSNGSLTSGIIQGNLSGDTSIASATSVIGSGYIQAGQIGALSIHGNVTAGANSAGGIANSGAIRSGGAITSLTIGGQVTGTSANPVIISALSGSSKTKPASDLAIQSVNISQAATYLDILAGYSPTVGSGATITNQLGTPTDGSAQIGTVTFGSTLSASNIVAGAEPDPTTGFFGTSGNMAIPSHTGNLHSSIASIIVAGTATGDSVPTDSFGFVAENLDSVKVDGASIPTNLTPGVPESVNGTNLYLLEVS